MAIIDRKYTEIMVLIMIFIGVMCTKISINSKYSINKSAIFGIFLVADRDYLPSIYVLFINIYF